LEAVKEWFGLLARLATGGVWVVAGAIKLPDPRESVFAVRAYELLPISMTETVGYLLPILEVVVGLLLIVGLLTRISAVVSGLLFVAFIIGIASVWARGIEIDCGCFGGGGTSAGASSDYPFEIARDVVLLALSAYLVIWPRTRLAIDNKLFPPLDRNESSVVLEEEQGPSPRRPGG
jgi:uncharacterized membrane protein YphA (DoxX/SURF4 family)